MNTDNQEQIDQPLTIGHAQFHQSFTPELQKQLITKRIGETLEGKDWHLIMTKKIDLKWKKILPHIKKATCKLLYSRFDQDKKKSPTFKQILLSISSIEFTQLKLLCIKGQLMCNIQTLAFLNCQQIKEIYLQSNNITNTKAFNKTKWELLQSFDLNYNKILESDFHRVHTSKKAYYMYTERNNSVQLQRDQVSGIAKMELRYANQICLKKIQKNIGIKTDVALEAIKRKYPTSAITYSRIEAE